MSITKSLLSLAAVCLFTTSIAPAAVVMDATTNNGDMEGGASFWSGGPPTGWDSTPSGGTLSYNYDDTAMHYYTVDGFFNTGIAVTASTQYTISGVTNSVVGLGVNFSVYATENADGTGTSVLLAQANFTGGNQAGPAYGGKPELLAIGPATGATTTGAVAGYYVQVRTATDQNVSGYYWVDDVVVTSQEVVPEPAALGLLVPATIAFCRRRKA